MGMDDKISNKAEEFGGKTKETVGSLTGNEELRAEGKADQASAGVKQVFEKVKDAAEDAAEGVKGAIKGIGDKIDEAKHEHEAKKAEEEYKGDVK